MGLFGGPNIENLEAKGDIAKLVEIHLNTGNDKHRVQTEKALLRIGQGTIYALLQAAYETENSDTPQEARARALLLKMGAPAIETLVGIARGKDDDARILAVELLADMNASEALPSVEWVLALIHGRHGMQPAQLEGAGDVRVIVYVYSVVANIAHRFGSQHAVSTLIKALAVHRENDDFCNYMVPVLIELTGEDVGGRGDPAHWIRWWESQGHSLEDPGIAESLVEWEQLELLGAINRLYPVERNRADNLKYHLEFRDGRSQDVMAYRCNEVGGRKLINVCSSIVELQGKLKGDLIAELLILNGRQMNGTIQVSVHAASSDGGMPSKHLEVADMFFLEGMTPDLYTTILTRVAGLADDLEKDLVGEDHH